MYIKKDDNIIVIAGKDKGKTGKIVKALPRKSMVIISGVNVKKRHQRPTRSNQKGQIIERALPIHVSNVALVDPKTSKQTRIGKKLVGNRMVRVTKKSSSELK